jgi:hypothetical protein
VVTILDWKGSVSCASLDSGSKGYSQDFKILKSGDGFVVYSFNNYQAPVVSFGTRPIWGYSVWCDCLKKKN